MENKKEKKATVQLEQASSAIGQSLNGLKLFLSFICTVWTGLACSQTPVLSRAVWGQHIQSNLSIRLLITILFLWSCLEYSTLLFSHFSPDVFSWCSSEQLTAVYFKKAVCCSCKRCHKWNAVQEFCWYFSGILTLNLV